MDRAAIEGAGIPGYELMTRAAESALGILQARWPTARQLVVYCGIGNNAGDGLVLARLAEQAGLRVQVNLLSSADGFAGDAALAHRDCVAAGVDVRSFAAPGAEPVELDQGADADIGGSLETTVDTVVVDALLGIGLDRPVSGLYAAAVERINGSGSPVLALDIPSGLHGYTGAVMGLAVRATVTVTFVGLKTGLFLGLAPDYCGDIEFCNLAIPQDAATDLPVLRRLTLADLRVALPRRRRLAHKGDHGRLLLIGGGFGMGGAIRLAAEGALRAGAGLVYVATHPSNVATVLAGRPEIICRGVETPADITAFVPAFDAVVIGPGLGQDTWAQGLWAWAQQAEQPVVVDADGLNLLATVPVRRSQWILTPHPGEGGRLLGCASAEIQSDRLAAVTSLAQRYDATVVLKGARTLVMEAGGTGPAQVCTAGNPGMASAGMGDVLAGVIGALWVQCLDGGRAARAGALLHALAGDAAAADGGGERGLLAADLLLQIRRWANPS